MNIQDVQSKIQTALPGASLRPVRESLFIENPADLPKVASFLKESPEFRLDYLSSVTAADYLEHLETVYHLYSMEKKTGPLVLRIRIRDRENPKVPSLVAIYRSAEFQEREAYDTYGIVYEGHPDLRRVFLWEGFNGFPMRKDYVQEDSEVLEDEDLDWLNKRGVTITEEMRQKAKDFKEHGPQKPKGEDQ